MFSMIYKIINFFVIKKKLTLTLDINQKYFAFY